MGQHTERWRPAARRVVLTLTAAVALLAGTAAGAQPSLPRIDGSLTMEQAVDLAIEKNLRVRAAQADSRAMASMRREALGPFWPQLSANGYVQLEILDAQVIVTRARFNAVAALAEYHAALAMWRRATGQVR